MKRTPCGWGHWHDSRLHLKRYFAPFIVALSLVVLIQGSASVAVGHDKKLDAADRATHEGDFASAEKLYRERLVKHKDDKAAQSGLSFALYKLRRLDEAFEVASALSSHEPLLAHPHAILGAILLSAGDFVRSARELQIALELDSDEALAVEGLALIDLYENRLKSSMSGFRRAIQLNPDDPDYYYNLAQAAARDEHFVEAADSYDHFLRIAPRTDGERRARIEGLINFLRYLGTRTGLYLTGGASRVVLPFDLVRNRPIINVRIGSQKELLRFVVDTGSGMCVVSQKTAERLGLHSVARGGLARAVGGGGRFEIVYGFISSLQLNEAKVENVPVYIRPFFENQEPVDGYLGLSVLAKYITTIDYGSRTMTLAIPSDSSARELAAADGLGIPLRTTGGGFRSGEIRLDGIDRPLNFIVDTGATITVVSEGLATREEMGRFALGPRLRIYGAAGITDGVQMLQLPGLRLGQSASANVTAAVLDLASLNETSGFEQSGILGGNVLSRYRLTFDFPSGRVRFQLLDTLNQQKTVPQNLQQALMAAPKEQ